MALRVSITLGDGVEPTQIDLVATSIGISEHIFKLKKRLNNLDNDIKS